MAPENDPSGTKIIPKVIEEEMKNAYVTYAMSVIVGRALPDVRDGLKPVHRRVLYAMHDLGMQHNKPFKKCVRIVGEVLGKYHPHGDVAVYDSLVRMAQDFSLRYTLIKGQGNFGSIDGDNAAAMRYCVTGNTLVLTNKGLIPIEEISSKSEEKINLTILNYQGKEKKAIKFFNSGKQKIIKITTQQDYSLRGSYNHPVLCFGLNESGFPSLRWKLLEEINTSDYVLLNRNFSLFSSTNSSLKEYFPLYSARMKKVSLPTKINNKLAFLLGALVSEGSFHQNKIIFNNQDLKFYQAVKSSILANFPEVTLYERSIAGNCRELELYLQQVVHFLINLGLKEAKAHQKEVPHIIFKSKKETIRSFLKALFEGDGSIQVVKDQRHGGTSIQITYDSKSRRLLEQLKILLLNFGIITSCLSKDKRHECYRLVIHGAHNVDIFRKEIGFFSQRKNETLDLVRKINKSRMSKIDYIPYLNEYLRKNYPYSFVKKNNLDRYNLLEKNYSKIAPVLKKSDKKLIDWLLERKYFFNKIKKIEQLPEETVYSIKVDNECHSFVANGFINHNTECKMQKLAEELLKDIEKNAVKFKDNFDGTLKEPEVLPCKFPNLLVNGSSGIAVGMATNMPPHNMNEVCDAVTAVIDNPEITAEELLQIVPGPDFPTGGEVLCGPSLVHAYAKGKGKVAIKSTCKIEGDKIIVTEIPYQVNMSELIEEIADLVRDKRVLGIRNINNESDQEGIRIVVELKKDVDPNVILNQLYQYSRLQISYGLIMLALVNNEPKLLGMKDILEQHILHRKDVIKKRTEHDLAQAREKVEILEGLLTAINNIDEVIAGIKRSKNIEEARNFLINTYSLSEIQAKAILEMRLQKIAALEQEKIRLEHQELLEKIKYYLQLLSSEKMVLDVIKEEMQEIKENYGDERKSRITQGNEADTNVDMEDLIEEEQVIVTMTNSGYVKRVSLDAYRTQKRGGRGVKAADMKEEDFVERLYVASTHDYLLYFTDKGQVYWLKVYHIPEGSRTAKGKHISNLLELKPEEKITAIVPVRSFEEGYLFMATKDGTVKKTGLMEFSNPRKGGIRAINLDETDSLVGVKYTDGSQEIILATRLGSANRFNENAVRSMGRAAGGVRGIRLEEEDEVIGMLAAEEGKEILTLTDKGYGKRTPVSEYRLCNRGGKGVTNIKITDKNGPVKAVMLVDGSEELMVMSKNGIAIRMKCSDISSVGRATQGVRVIRLSEDDQLAATATIVSEENENGGNGVNHDESNEPENNEIPDADTVVESDSKAEINNAEINDFKDNP